MTPDDKYRVIHQSPSQRLPRTSVLRFHSETETHYLFHGNPLIDIVEIPKAHVKSITPDPLYPAVFYNKALKARVH